MHDKSIWSSFILGLQIKSFYCCCRWKESLVLAGHWVTAVYFCVRLCSGEDARISQTRCRRHAGPQLLGTAWGQTWQGVAPWGSAATPRPATLGPWCPHATLGLGSRSKMKFSLQQPARTSRTHTWPPPSDQSRRLLMKLLWLPGETFPKQHFFFFSFCLGQHKFAFIPWMFTFL